MYLQPSGMKGIDRAVSLDLIDFLSITGLRHQNREEHLHFVL